MKYLTRKMGLDSFRIAQAISPFKTGNLRYNAMYIINLPNGFEIIYDDSFAHYIDYLEFGTSNSTKWVKFIENTTFNAIVQYLEMSLKRTRKPRSFELGDVEGLYDGIYDDYVNTPDAPRDALMEESLRRYEMR